MFRETSCDYGLDSAARRKFQQVVRSHKNERGKLGASVGIVELGRAFFCLA